MVSGHTRKVPRGPRDRDGQDLVDGAPHSTRRLTTPPHSPFPDEVFYLLDGEVFIHRPDEGDVTLGAGDTLLAPKGAATHTYRVESETARWLTVTNGTDFENFVRAASRPAEAPELPPASPPPTEEQAAELGRLSARFGIDLVGPPLH